MDMTLGLRKHRSRGQGRPIIAALFATAVATVAVHGSFCVVDAATQSRPNLGAYPQGEITQIRPAALEIGGKTYSLHPNLTIIRDDGQPLEYKVLRVGMTVHYHAKEEVVDYIIAIVPR
jgi:hypothetical protein